MAGRGRTRGSVFQHQNGRWYIRYDAGTDASGRRIQRSGGGFATRAEAEQRLATRLLALQAGQVGPDLSELVMAQTQAALKRALAPRQRIVPGKVDRDATAKLLAELGWRVGNSGENRIVAALHQLGVAPAEVEQQFTLGPYMLDCAFVRARVALEGDGWVHGHMQAIVKDAVRDTMLTHWGWTVYRINTEQNDAAIMAEVRLAVEAARKAEA
jgi:very-short-patch-repair endonuclease